MIYLPGYEVKELKGKITVSYDNNGHYIITKKGVVTHCNTTYVSVGYGYKDGRYINNNPISLEYIHRNIKYMEERKEKYEGYTIY